MVVGKRDDPRCSVGDIVEATETDDGRAIKGRFDLDTEFGKSAYRNTKGRRVSGLSIVYAIRNSSKTAAGNELTDLELFEVSIVARGAVTVGAVELRPSARASAPACVPVEVWDDGFPEVGLIDRARVPSRVPQRRRDELVAV